MCFKISNAPTIKLIPKRMKTETENLAQLTQTILEPLSTPPRPEQGHRVSLDRAIVNTSSLSLFSVSISLLLFPLLGLSLSRSLSLLRSLSFPWPSWSLTLSSQFLRYWMGEVGINFFFKGVGEGKMSFPSNLVFVSFFFSFLINVFVKLRNKK